MYIMENIVSQIIEYIGYHGDEIIILLVIIHMYNRIPYLLSYCIFYFLNKLINQLLKSNIQEKRPENGVFLRGEYDDEINNYGMPSFHMQSMMYSTIFLYLSISSPKILLLCMICICFTIYQKIKYNRHTVIQLIIGMTIGVINGYLFYEFTKIYLQKNIYKKIF